MDRKNGDKITGHIKNKHKLQNLEPATFAKILDKIMISDKEREIMTLLYVKHKTAAYVADVVGYAESTVRLKHRKIVERLSRYL